MRQAITRHFQHSSHWGTFQARKTATGVEIVPHPEDAEPSPILGNIVTSLNHPLRIARPLIRRGWLENGPGPDFRRGRDDYVETDWDKALDLAAAELKRLGAAAPAQAGMEPASARHVFGGSYGWASAGRFHHAQSQMHRFLNCAFGGYVRSVDSYSSAAGAVILHYTVGEATTLTRDHPYWDQFGAETELVLAFGGLANRNTQISNGGITHHPASAEMRKLIGRGGRIVMFSPSRNDLPEDIACEWLSPRPATDVALMLGMAWHLHNRQLVDRDFIDRFTVGYDRFLRYLLGESDGVPKTPLWAEGICRIPAAKIAALAEEAAGKRTLINVTYSLQRAEHGEQPVWMALVLASMLGQIGLPGGGFSYGLGSIGNIGKAPIAVSLPTFPQGRNGISDFIPVARIADLLLNPGQAFTYKGETRTYNDIKLVYWAGGNPFHHHQDLARLEQAFARPETIIVHESVRTATTRYADIVFPATITAERDDIGASANDPFLLAMEKFSEPYGEARHDYDIFAALAERLGLADVFTEGKSAAQWMAEIYEPTRQALAEAGWEAPDFLEFWTRQQLKLPVKEELGLIARFRADPDKARLTTPSGKIEIASETIASYGYKEVAEHPAWLEPAEWLGAPLAERFPLQLVANQPATRLHSQLDFGAFSASSKISGREPARIHPADAAARNIRDGDIIRIFNDRGAVQAGAIVTTDIAQGVIQLATGAWLDPVRGNDGLMLCRAGNPNVVTRDQGASPLSGGCTGQLCLVDVEKNA